MTVAQWGSLGMQVDAPCRVFVSYSHEDGVKAERFHALLRRLLHSEQLQNLGLTEPQLFYDKRRLVDKDLWTAEIAGALQTCEILIYLVSESSLKPEGYCWKQELPEALFRQRQPPPTLVTVHLEDVGHWEGQILRKGTDTRSLGLSKALPMAPQKGTRCRPLSQWAPESDGWAALARELTVLLCERLGVSRSRPQQDAAFDRHAAHDPRLLPYFCDQEHLHGPLETGLSQWKRDVGRTMVLFLQGDRDADHPGKVFQRIKASHLRRLATPMHEYHFHPPAPLRLRGDALVREYIATFVEVLSGRWPELHRGLVSDLGVDGVGQQLAAKLQGESVPVVLLGELPKTAGRQQELELAEALRGLVRFLDGLPLHEAPPDHGRVILCLSAVEPGLVESWGLPASQRTHVVKLGAVDELTLEDVRRWYRTCGERLNLCEQKLLRCFEQETAPVPSAGWFDRLREKVSRPVAARREMRLARFAALVDSPACQKS